MLTFLWQHGWFTDGHTEGHADRHTLIHLCISIQLSLKINTSEQYFYIFFVENKGTCSKGRNIKLPSQEVRRRKGKYLDSIWHENAATFNAFLTVSQLVK